jgi:hypothetical protein
LICFMARPAIRDAMRPFQREVGQLMIKRLSIQGHDISVPTYVIGVARRTLNVADLGTPTVKPFRSRQISIDFFVAGPAQRGLADAFESYVTRRTVGFVLRMPLDQGPGHNQRFNRARRCDPVHAKTQRHTKSNRDH